MLFVLNVFFWTTAENFDWGRVLLLHCPVTVAVIVAEIRSSLYDGVICGESQANVR
jgi:hypothetical protein